MAVQTDGGHRKVKHDRVAGKNAGDVITQIPRLRSRDERERTQMFYAEGPHMVVQAARASLEIQICVISPGLLTSHFGWQVVKTIRVVGVSVIELSPAAFRSISFKENLQGIRVTVCSQIQSLRTLDLTDILGCIALDSVGNLGNLEAISRTCGAIGCIGVVMLGGTTDPYHPAVIRASMGAVFWQRLIRAEFAGFIEWVGQRD